MPQYFDDFLVYQSKQANCRRVAAPDSRRGCSAEVTAGCIPTAFHVESECHCRPALTPLTDTSAESASVLHGLSAWGGWR